MTQKNIGKAVGIKGDDLIDKLWPQMTAEQIVHCSRYPVGEEQRSELKELIENLLALVA